MTDEEMNAKLQEIDNKYFQKISENWDIQQSVQFSLRELHILHNAIANDCARYFKTFQQEDESMRVLMRKIDKIIEDFEVQIRDGQNTSTSDCGESGRAHWDADINGNINWSESSSEQEKSEQPKNETFNNIHDFNDGIFDPTYINDIADCSDLGIYPWGDS